MDKFDLNVNSEYREKIAKGELELLALEEGNWDKYINKEKTMTYYISKDDTCCSGAFGNINWFCSRYLDDCSRLSKAQLSQCGYDLIKKHIENVRYYSESEKEEILNNIKIIGTEDNKHELY